mgnify:CR=1 FL=1
MKTKTRPMSRRWSREAAFGLVPPPQPEPFPVGSLVSDPEGLPRMVIGSKPDGRLMTVGAPDPPWVLVGRIEVSPPSSYRPLSATACLGGLQPQASPEAELPGSLIFPG